VKGFAIFIICAVVFAFIIYTVQDVTGFGGFGSFVITVILIAIVIGVVLHFASKTEEKKLAEMTPEERADYIKSQNEATERQLDIHYDIRCSHEKWLEYNGVTTDVDYSYETKEFLIRYVIDTNNKCIYLANKDKYDFKCFRFSEIIGVEIKENDETTGSLGNAILGGIVAGGVGAIVGSNITNKRILSYDAIIYTKDIKNPRIVLNLIDEQVFSNSIEYKNAIEFSSQIYASAKAILANQEQVENSSNFLSTNKTPHDCKITENSGFKQDIAIIGSKVIILDVELNEKEEYTIVDSNTSTEGYRWMISCESPLGEALLNCKCGDNINVMLDGEIACTYKIISIE